MSATAIDSKLNTALRQSKALYQKETSWQEKVDSLLDRMNDLNRVMTALHSVLLKLSFEIERDMDGFKQSKSAPEMIKKLVGISARTLNKIYKSDLYPGVKTTYHVLKTEISYLNELAHDRKVSMALDEDGEMTAIVQSTLARSTRK